MRLFKAADERTLMQFSQTLLTDTYNPYTFREQQYQISRSNEWHGIRPDATEPLNKRVPAKSGRSQIQGSCLEDGHAVHLLRKYAVSAYLWKSPYDILGSYNPPS